MTSRNPFQYGRELAGAELVDRENELRVVLDTMEQAGRLFMIGPRRYGKTSILHAASEQAEERGIVVLRRDAEAFPTLKQLAESVVAGAADRLADKISRAGAKLRTFFGVLRPEINYNPLEQSFSATITRQPRKQEAMMLTTLLDGLDRMAADSGRKVAVVIDEFQHVLKLQGPGDGLAAERQLCAAIQRHRHVAYVLSGSKIGLLSQMTSDPARPFYRFGSRLFVGPVPRNDFRTFIRTGFESARTNVEEDAITAILDLAEDVPYNVQRLAHSCWNHARAREQSGTLSTTDVNQVLDRLVRRDDPFYTQVWNRLTAVQQRALLALVKTKGVGLFSHATLKRHELPLSSLRSAVQKLTNSGIARPEEAMGSIRHRLEDPFFAAWIELFVARN